MELTKQDIRNDCPVCNETIIEPFNRYHNMVMFWGSVHGKCPNCGVKLAYACIEYIREKYAYPNVVN